MSMIEKRIRKEKKKRGFARLCKRKKKKRGFARLCKRKKKKRRNALLKMRWRCARPSCRQLGVGNWLYFYFHTHVWKCSSQDTWACRKGEKRREKMVWNAVGTKREHTVMPTETSSSVLLLLLFFFKCGGQSFVSRYKAARFLSSFFFFVIDQWV